MLRSAERALRPEPEGCYFEFSYDMHLELIYALDIHCVLILHILKNPLLMYSICVENSNSQKKFKS